MFGYRSIPQLRSEEDKLLDDLRLGLLGPGEIRIKIKIKIKSKREDC